MGKRAGLRMLVAAGTIACLLVAVEFGSRWLFPLRVHGRPRTLLVLEREKGRVELETNLMLPSVVPGIRRGFLPGITFKWCYDVSHGSRRPAMDADGCITAVLNAAGQRGPLIPKPRTEHVYRMAVLGDSFTFGHGVPFEEVFVPKLERLVQVELDAGSTGLRCEAVNLGVPGFNTRDVLHYLQDEALGYEPDLLIYGFYLNDVFVAEDIGKVQGPIQAAYDASIYGDPVGLARYSQLYRRFERMRARATYDAAASYAEAFAPDSAQWLACQELILEMQVTVRAAGVDFLFVLFPELIGLEEQYPHTEIHARIGDWCRAQGIDFFDVLPAQRGTASSSLWVHPTDKHPNELAHTLAARGILEAVRERLP